MPTKLGQNFLTSYEIAEKILKEAHLSRHDCVLEIGPGKGILTEGLVRTAGRVIAVEIDGNLAKTLRDKFKKFKNLEIIKNDILKVNLNSLLRSFAPKYKVIANLPYYITSPVIRMFLETESPPSEMILMVQKEVAERIVAVPGQMSILSVAVQYYAEPKILFYVGKENFDPVPEVDSCVIKIANLHSPASNCERKNFFRFVRAGFCSRRKTLVNNLSNSFHMDKKKVEEKIKKVGLLPTVRAQELSIEDWKKLSILFAL